MVRRSRVDRNPTSAPPAAGVPTPAAASASAVRVPSEEELTWAARVQRLEGEVAGLRKAMRTRGLIEQAKGMLAERFSCDPEQAFGYLSKLSQDANVRVADIAADVVGAPRPAPPIDRESIDRESIDREPAGSGVRSTAEPPAGEAMAWLRVMLDTLHGQAQLLAPVRDDRGSVVDFVIEYTSGRTREVVGRRLLDVYPHLLTNGVFEAYAGVLERGEPWQTEAVPETVMQHGRQLRRVISRRAARLGDRVVVAWQQLDRELRREQQLSRMEALGRLGWIDWDLVSNETYWSPGTYRILGRDPARGPASLPQVTALIAGEDLPSVAELVSQVLELGQEGSAEFRVERDGGLIHLRVVVEPRLDPGGRLSSVAAVVQDVTTVREAYQQVRRVEEQLAGQRIRLAAEQSLTQRMRQVLYPTSQLDLEVPGARVVARHLLPESAGDVRGDFCDATVLPDGDLLLTIGDIFGSGVAAAATMSRLVYPVRALALSGASPAQILELLNTDLRRDADPPLASLLLARYGAGTGKLRWAQAGHQPPAVLRAGQATLLDRPAGVALGLLPHPVYAEAELRLHPGDIVACFTDGVVYGRGDKVDDPLATLLSRLRHAARRRGLPGVLDACLRPREDEACLLALQAVESR
jgi:PAS domain S-box-containing protein